MEENELLKKAKKRVKAKKEFFAHLVTFCAVSFFLFVINFVTTPGFWWFLFPLAGWGMAVIGHYFSVFGLFNIRSEDWEKQEIAKELERLKEDDDPNYEELDLQSAEDQLDLKEKIKLKKDWDDQEFV